MQHHLTPEGELITKLTFSDFDRKDESLSIHSLEDLLLDPSFGGHVAQLGPTFLRRFLFKFPVPAG